jgi:hypothetical protein
MDLQDDVARRLKNPDSHVDLVLFRAPQVEVIDPAIIGMKEGEVQFIEMGGVVHIPHLILLAHDHLEDTVVLDLHLARHREALLCNPQDVAS